MLNRIGFLSNAKQPNRVTNRTKDIQPELQGSKLKESPEKDTISFSGQRLLPPGGGKPRPYVPVGKKKDGSLIYRQQAPQWFRATVAAFSLALLMGVGKVGFETAQDMRNKTGMFGGCSPWTDPVPEEVMSLTNEKCLPEREIKELKERMEQNAQLEERYLQVDPADLDRLRTILEEKDSLLHVSVGPNGERVLSVFDLNEETGEIEFEVSTLDNVNSSLQRRGRVTPEGRVQDDTSFWGSAGLPLDLAEDFAEDLGTEFNEGLHTLIDDASNESPNILPINNGQLANITETQSLAQQMFESQNADTFVYFTPQGTLAVVSQAENNPMNVTLAEVARDDSNNILTNSDYVDFSHLYHLTRDVLDQSTGVFADAPRLNQSVEGSIQVEKVNRALSGNPERLIALRDNAIIIPERVQTQLNLIINNPEIRAVVVPNPEDNAIIVLGKLPEPRPEEASDRENSSPATPAARNSIAYQKYSNELNQDGELVLLSSGTISNEGLLVLENADFSAINNAMTFTREMVDDIESGVDALSSLSLMVNPPANTRINPDFLENVLPLTTNYEDFLPQEEETPAPESVPSEREEVQTPQQPSTEAGELLNPGETVIEGPVQPEETPAPRQEESSSESKETPAEQPLPLRRDLVSPSPTE